MICEKNNFVCSKNKIYVEIDLVEQQLRNNQNGYYQFIFSPVFMHKKNKYYCKKYKNFKKLTKHIYLS